MTSVEAMVERELSELPPIFAEAIMRDVRKAQVQYRLDWGRNPTVLEMGVGQWDVLANLLRQHDDWRECITRDQPMLWGMRLVEVPHASGLMAK